MLRFRTLLAVAALALVCLPAYAEDGESPRVTKRVDLRRYHVPPAAPGSRIPVPSDIVAKMGDASDDGIWSLDRSEDSRTWLPFEDPALEEHAISPDTVAELLRSSVSHQAALAEALSIEQEGDGLLLAGSKEAVAAVDGNVAWLLAGLAPSLRIDALLMGGGVGAEPRLRAMGGLRVWPGRWTRVYLQESTVP